MNTKFVYNRKNKLDVNGRATIVFCAYVDRKNRIYKSTSIKVRPDEWSEINQKVIKHEDREQLNSNLKAFRVKYETLLYSQFMKGERIDLNSSDKKEIYLFEYFTEIIEHIKKVSSPGTVMIYSRCLKYIKEYHPQKILIKEVNTKFVREFEQYLIESKNLSVNSRGSLLKKLKKILNDAVKDGIIEYSSQPFNKGYKVKIIPTTKESISIEELKILQNLNMEERPELERARDIFLFCCYTSMRFGDVINLSFEEFIQTKDGITLEYRPSKTAQTNNKVIRFNASLFWGGALEEIILKYLEINKPYKEFNRPHRLFFKITNQAFNRQLKELQRFAKIHTVLTSHVARHTAISLLINNFNIDITKVQLIAGHSKIEQTRKYLNVSENEINESAKAVNWEF